MSRRNYPFILLFSALFFSGCLGTQYLKENEYLLHKQKINGGDKVATTALEALYQQKPNKRLPLVPFASYVWMYETGAKKYNKEELGQKRIEIEKKFNYKLEKAGGRKQVTKKLNRRKARKLARIDKTLDEGNLFMRLGEPIVAFDSALASRTVDQLSLYLKSKGYLNSKVNYNTDTTGRKIKVIYNVVEGQPHKLDSILYSANDTAISVLISTNASKSILKKGDNYNQDKLTQERERIEDMLKNNGYYDFSRQYINYDVDTALGEKKVFVEMIIKNPVKRNDHKIFVVDSVVFTTDATVVNVHSKRDTAYYNGITYKFFRDMYSKKILDRRIFIYPGSKYSKENTFETQRQLANLDIFKFININYDTTGGRFIANVVTSPLDKYQWSNEIGVNVGYGGFPGPFFSLGFKNRNVFGGLEVLDISGQVGIEGVSTAYDPQDIYESKEYSGNLSLTFPQFLFPFATSLKSRIGNLNPKTRIQAGYTFIDRPEFIRSNTKASFSYTWQNKNEALYNFSLAELNLINSSIQDPQFSNRLDTLELLGNNLKRSFKPSFVSSMVFYAILNFNQYGNYANNASYLKLYVESGGTTLNFLKNDTSSIIFKNLESYKFYKLNTDYRHYVPVNNYYTIAYRLNVGFAQPYGSNRALPYEKYFFAGGSTSIRAWRPRRLGPGSYTPKLNDNPEKNGLYDYRFEQQGEILLEASIEFRRNILGFLDGALFIDAGNIWTIKEDQSRPGSKFDFRDFYREIAVGYGLGFRFNFSFLIVRSDFGIKLIDPARPVGERFVGNKLTFRRPLNDKVMPVINIGIGYPF